MIRNVPAPLNLNQIRPKRRKTIRRNQQMLTLRITPQRNDRLMLNNDPSIDLLTPRNPRMNIPLQRKHIAIPRPRKQKKPNSFHYLSESASAE